MCIRMVTTITTITGTPLCKSQVVFLMHIASCLVTQMSLHTGIEPVQDNFHQAYFQFSTHVVVVNQFVVLQCELTWISL